jgi:hypothetical protein
MKTTKWVVDYLVEFNTKTLKWTQRVYSKIEVPAEDAEEVKQDHWRFWEGDYMVAQNCSTQFITVIILDVDPEDTSNVGE